MMTSRIRIFAMSKGLMIGIGIMAVITLLLWRENSSLHDKLGQARAAVTQAKQTNTNNLTTITDLGDRLDTCVRDREVDVAAGEAVQSALKADILDLEERGVEIRIEREEIFREPSCEELGNLDINAICPALARGMRVSADSIN
jgi:hypothetical protein